METERRRREQSLKEKVRHAIDDATSKQGNQNSNGNLKTGLYVIGVLVAVWGSQFVFSAVAGAIKQFKVLIRTIKEK
jgi:hypothetical protein